MSQCVCLYIVRVCVCVILPCVCAWLNVCVCVCARACVYDFGYLLLGICSQCMVCLNLNLFPPIEEHSVTVLPPLLHICSVVLLLIFSFFVFFCMARMSSAAADTPGRFSCSCPASTASAAIAMCISVRFCRRLHHDDLWLSCKKNINLAKSSSKNVSHTYTPNVLSATPFHLHITTTASTM